MSKTFDVNKAIIENYVFESGNLNKLSEFVKEQGKLHSINRMSGKLFNPLGFSANLVNLSDNPVLEQALKKAVSEATGNAGVLDTTDGQTFSRVLDNDAEEIQIRDAEVLKGQVGGGENFFSSALSSVSQAWLNKVSQAVPFIEVNGHKSIMAQSLAYSNELFNENFKGSQTSLADLYENKEASSEWTTNIEPIGEKALNYTHDLYSLSQIDILRIRRLIEDVKQGVYAQSIAVKKPESVREYEDLDNISKRVRSRFSEAISNYLGISKEVRNEDFYVRRTAEYTPPQMGAKLYSSGSYFVRKTDEKLFDMIFKSGRMGHIESMDDLHKSFMTEFIAQNATNYTRGRSESTDFEEVNADKLFSTKDIKKNLDNHNSLANVRYNNKRKHIMIQHREAINDYSFSELLDVDVNNDPVMMSKIYNSAVDGEVDVDNFLYMRFEDVRTNNSIFLRPYIDGLTDDTQATYDESDYLGRFESIPKYRKTTGSLNFSFIIHATTPKELLMMYKKLEFLESLNYPMADESFRQVKNPLIRFSLGDLYKNRGGYITSFSKAVTDGETAWETRKGYTAPKLIRCSVTIQKFNDRMPYYPKGSNFSDHYSNFDINYELED